MQDLLGLRGGLARRQLTATHGQRAAGQGGVPHGAGAATTSNTKSSAGANMAADNTTTHLQEPYGHPSMQQDFSQAPASAQTMGQKIFEQARDPILVVLISVLLSVPAVYQTLSSLLSKIPGGSASLAPVILRAVLSGILFFGIRKVL